MLHMVHSQCEHCPIGGFYGWRSMDQHPQQSLLAGREDIHPHLEMRYSHVRPHVDYQNDSSSILHIYIIYSFNTNILFELGTSKSFWRIYAICIGRSQVPIIDSLTNLEHISLTQYSLFWFSFANRHLLTSTQYHICCTYCHVGLESRCFGIWTWTLYHTHVTCAYVIQFPLARYALFCQRFGYSIQKEMSLVLNQWTQVTQVPLIQRPHGWPNPKR